MYIIELTVKRFERFSKASAKKRKQFLAINIIS